jgi:hypothetical protein
LDEINKIKSLMIKYFIVLLSILAVNSCSDRKSKEDQKTPDAPAGKIKEVDNQNITRLNFKEAKENYVIGDPVQFELSAPDTINVDSVKTYANSKIQNTATQNNDIIDIQTSNLPVGNNTFKVEAYLDNGKRESHYKSLEFLSDIQPRQLTVNIIETYPHDPNAYTQGLFFDNGFLYEGTGKRGRLNWRQAN